MCQHGTENPGVGGSIPPLPIFMPLRWRFACPGSGVGAMGDDSEFWRDDAAATAQRQTGNVLRMPAASTVVPSELVGSYATPSADYRADSGKQYSTTATLVCMGVILAVFAGVIYLLTPNAVTLAEFNRLEDGMTPQQCTEIIGQPATSAVTYKHESKMLGSFESTGLIWENDSESACTVVFLNGKAIQRISKGLK